MKFYDETKPLYIETYPSGVWLRATLQQTRSKTSCLKDEAPDNSILRLTAFASKSLTGAEMSYSNIERDTLGRVYGLKKFHYYCLVTEVSITTDHKPLTAIFKKDVATSKRLQ